MIASIEFRPGLPETRGPWGRLVRVRNVLRPDGRYGTAEITGEPDTFWTAPARMSIDGRKIAGHVSTDDLSMTRHEDGGWAWEAGPEDLDRNNWPDLVVYVFYPRPA